MNCIFYSLYLPSIKKKYVVEHFFDMVKIYQKNAKVYIGIQYNSIPETEDILRKLKGSLKIVYNRVSKEMMIDSDASGFVEALELYSEDRLDFDYCYFTHSKSITSDNDRWRIQLYNILFKTDLKTHFVLDDIGSWGPYLTIPVNKPDIEKLSCLNEFMHIKINPLKYFYAHTMFVIRGDILKQFILNVSRRFYNTPISDYSDRYMFERDFCHITELFGCKPSCSNLVGNYWNNFISPSKEEYQAMLEGK